MKKIINTVKHGDCIKLMSKMPDACVDLVITDPPFAIEFAAKRSNYNRHQSRVLKGYNEIKSDDYQAFSIAWLEQATRMLKDTGSMYIFSGWNHLKELLIAMDKCELTTINHLVWKYQFGVTTKRKFVTSHYHCLFVCKDDKKRRFYPYSRFSQDEKTSNGGSAHYRDKEDVWNINREYWTGDKKTPTKLPAEIIKKMLAYSSEEGDLVMDPFLGSGQVAVVSKMLKRNYIGFEIAKDYYDFVCARLDSGQYRIAADKVAAEEQADELGVFSLNAK